MKILMLTPYLPYPLLSGGQIRTYNLLKKLSQEHEITLFALIKENSERQYIAELEKYCAKVKLFKRSHKPFTLKNILQTAISSYPFLVIRNHAPSATKAIQAELQNGAYDLIHAETFYMMPHLPKTDVPVMLVEQTIEYLGYESYANRAKKWLRPLLRIDIDKIKRWEKYYWEACQQLVVMSEEDKQFIAQEIGSDTKIEVVANGVDLEWFEEKKAAIPTEPTVLSVGTFKWLPNVEAVSFLVAEVWPLIKQQVPNARLWIVGNAPTKEVVAFQHKDTSITVTGGIPDIRDAFKGAHVLVAPVFSGKGTRYKILEALASETPVVATPIAVEGLAVKPEQEVLIGADAQELADQTVRLLKNSALRAELAKRGHAFVGKNFDWDQIAKKLDRLYRSFSKPKSDH